jgi:uncharacterized Zn finger protein
MGCFDSFYHPCPKCGADVEWTTRAGSCGMHEYRLYADPPPPVVAGDLDGRTARCGKCGHVLTVHAQVVITVS